MKRQGKIKTMVQFTGVNLNSVQNGSQSSTKITGELWQAAILARGVVETFYKRHYVSGTGRYTFYQRYVTS